MFHHFTYRRYTGAIFELAFWTIIRPPPKKRMILWDMISNISQLSTGKYMIYHMILQKRYDGLVNIEALGVFVFLFCAFPSHDSWSNQRNRNLRPLLITWGAGSKRLTKGNVISASTPALEPFTAVISGSKVHRDHQIVSWEDVPTDLSEHVLAPDLWGEKNSMSLVVIATRRGRISTYSICYMNINITYLVDIHFSHPTSSHLVQFQWGNFPKILFQSISFSESLSFWECILAWCARSWIEALFYWQPLLRPRRYPCRRLGHKQVDSRTQGGSKKKWERLT